MEEPDARRDPTSTALHRIVRQHLESFVRFASERSGRSLPVYVVEEFREYLRCGVLSHGFARARCGGCGYEKLVAFSCKRRGVCPSCGGRRMAGTAARVCDGVLPAVAVRQWVLSVPFELRRVLAAKPAALNEVSRAFWEEICRWYRAASERETNEAERIEAGAITFVQRFGGSLNLNVHFHVVAADGVWRCPVDGSDPIFVATRAPTRDDLQRVLERLVARLARRFERRALAERAMVKQSSDDETQDGALAGCLRAALARGTYARIEAGCGAEALDEARFARRPPRAEAAEVAGFNLHASVVIGASDHEGRERLLRYVSRPAVVKDRVTELADGRVAYRLKQPGGRGETHRVMEPMEFMARLAALVPPPRHPLVRYHGVFAPNSPWRAGVVPTPPDAEAACAAPSKSTIESSENRPSRSGEASSDPVDSKGDATSDEPPRERAVKLRIDWATLLHRVWQVDALVCSRCMGRLRFIAVITERAVIVRILDHLGIPSERVIAAPARSGFDTS
ncbi:MAG: transposase [Polyangiales bacterium]